MRIPLFRLFGFLVLSAWFGLAHSARCEPVITEFMADNQSTVQDEDGDFSDYIEIHNPTSTSIDLNNWCLTDNANDLAKWRFPAVTLPPGGFLIVWASGKDKRVPGQPLHTSFGLATGGEYLALVRPDGATVQQQFAPAYPPLEADESYGLQFTSTTLLAEGASAKYLIPTDGALGLNWTNRNFDDTTWANGTTGIGFGLLVPGINVRHVLKNTAFGTVNSIATADALLDAAPGSAIIATEATVIAPTVNFLGEGSDGHYGSNQIFPVSSGEPYAIKATGSISIPSAGTYTFGLNSDDGGRIRIDGSNVMVDDTNHGPVDNLGTVTLSAGLHAFEVIMWEGGGGDEVEFYSAAGSFTSWNSNMRLVGDTANGGLAAFTLPSGGGSNVIATNIESAMRNQNATGYFRVRFPASNASSFTALSLKMRFNDGYAAFLNGVPITSENAPGALAYNSAATATRTDEQSQIPSPSNAAPLIPQFVDGTNVLAIQGLNVSAADGSFLVLPELVGGVLNSAADPVFFNREKATPGAINGDYSTLGKVSDTKFSVDRGYFTQPFLLTITTTTPGATIRYTLNGSEPTATTGTVYAGPLNISQTTVIRAAAFKTGFQPTNVDTQTYLFLDDVLTQSPTGAAPPGWPSSSGTSQVLDYGMDPAIVKNSNPGLGGAQTVKNALASISAVSLVTDLPNLFNMNGSQGIYANPNGRGLAWERPCSLEWINPPDAQNPNGTSEFQIDCGMRIRGGYSRSTNNPKHAFHIYFRSDYGAGKLKYPLFGRFGASEFDQIDIRTAENYSWSFDGDSRNTFLREESTRLAQLEMGQPGSRVRYLHLFINGQYWGLFNLDERTEAAFSASYFGGKKEDYDVVKSEQDEGYVVGATDGNLDAWRDLWTKSRAHAASPTNANYFRMMGLAADGVTPTADPVLLDVDNLIDYMLLTFWTGNLDGATSAFLGNNHANNWFGSRRRNGTEGFRYFAHDSEHTFLNTGEDRTGPYPDANQNNFAYSNPMYLHMDLMGNAEYRLRWADRVQKHMFNGGALTNPAWTARFNQLAAIVDQPIIAESARWGDAKRSSPFTRGDWSAARNFLLGSYLPSRGNIVLNQLKVDGLYPAFNAPTITPFGGHISSGTSVTVSGATGTVYYMADGSDPRAIGGEIKPDALTYTTPLTITGDGERRLQFRSRNGSTWSALVDAVYLIDTEPASSSNLAISEIMYNPSPPTADEIAAGFASADDFEYLEFVNIGSKSVDLMGLYLYGPISFDFSNSHLDRILAPGERILIAADESAFAFRYGTGKPVAGSYQGHLGNGGEQIIVYSPTGESLIDVTYSDKNGWPTAADGDGFSLVRINPGSGNDANDPRSYRSSVDLGGSPGGSDAINYPAWKSANGVVSDSEDGDGDGVSAFKEYTDGGNVAVPDANRIPLSGTEAFTVNGTTSIYSTVRFPRRFAADDVTLVVETSPSVTAPNWTSSNIVFVSSTRQSDGSEVVTYRATDPFDKSSPLFWRIRQTISP